ncbi:MAG: hypothetical protein QOE56_438 [Solirubrobacterales bacterium]|jgi:hypothetical protein|nr:hypothetical protein [Solirubrobacterales bacterium]
MSPRRLTSLIPRPHQVIDVARRVIELAPGLPDSRSNRVEPFEPPPPPPPPVKPRPRPQAAKAKAKPGKAEQPKPRKAAKPKDPHHALNNPVADPDPTEWPDPYEKRPDPRDPPDPDGKPFGEEPHAPPGATSTSEPPPDQDPAAEARQEKLKRERLDQ